LSFPSPGDEKITKNLAHCEERPAPYVITDEKCAIFSNSVTALTLLTKSVISPFHIQHETGIIGSAVN
jgi:hypothetical protein